MCEMAALKPANYEVDELADAAMDVYQAMRDSLGMVAVVDEETRLDYEIFKAVEPDPSEVYNFIQNRADYTDLFIFHGRLATHGGETVENCHPLSLDCDECDIDFVLHNGVVHGYDQATVRRRENRGHTFVTNVDSELIAHTHGSVPENFEEAGEVTQFVHQPCYILLNSDRAYFYQNGTYEMNQNGEIARQRRPFGPEREYGEPNTHELIMTPGGDE